MLSGNSSNLLPETFFAGLNTPSGFSPIAVAPSFPVGEDPKGGITKFEIFEGDGS